MSIETTYQGQWSSDPELLKTLLDAGKDIVGKGLGGKLYSISMTNRGVYWVGDQNYSWEEFIEDWVAGYGVFFLVPSPLPTVEPSKLIWERPYEAYKIATAGKYTYRIWDHGVAEYSENKGKSWRPIQKCESKYWGFMEAEKAVYDWRMNHIKSMTQ